MRKRSIFKTASALAMAAIMTVGVSVTAFAENLYSNEAGVKVSLNSEGYESGTTIDFKLSEADKAVLGHDVLTLATVDDLFYFDAAKSSADLSTVKEAKVNAIYYFRDSNGKLVGDGGELVGYIGKGNDNYDNLNTSGQPLGYGQKFQWQGHVNNYSKGAIYEIFMEDNDGSWVAYTITFDADLFNYAKDTAITDTTTVATSSWASDAKGWWIQNTDGTYLKNTWYQNSDGKWYYMGADGYMLTNTTTPDGYSVNADGVWVQ